MITSVTEERLLVVSDVHLGNSLFHARRPFLDFLKYAFDNSYSVCINGDGIEIIQSSLAQITRDMSACTPYIRQLARNGMRVYYVVGNHDIVLEHFLDDWGIIRLVPFLNVTSGDARIHIEHGHLHDEGFLQFPKLYTVATLLGGLALKIHPCVYHGLERMKPVAERLRRLMMPGSAASEEDDRLERIPNEPPGFLEGADDIAKHGFDCVVFGHTHCEGQVELENGVRYMNTGCWLFKPYCVEINGGQVAFRSVTETLSRPSVPQTAPRAPQSSSRDFAQLPSG